jgi:hypothetical protein
MRTLQQQKYLWSAYRKFENGLFLSFFQAILGTGLISFDMLYIVYASMPDDKEVPFIWLFLLS